VDDEAALAVRERLRALLRADRGPLDRGAADEPLPQVALAPGRVNLIGEHVDYNDGWVLPMAIDRHVAVALAPRGDRRLVVHAAALKRTATIDLDDLRPPQRPRWHDVVAGAAWALREAGLDVRGAELLIDADLPRGAGLSSSAALELAVARALANAAGAVWDPLAMALACVRAEQRFSGVPCGVMDQVASACGRPGHALLLDCRTLAITPVPLPADAAFVVMDSGVHRALAGGEYAERRASCERALAAMRALRPDIDALRDADEDLLRRARASLDETTVRRASHVLQELPRPAAFVAALAAGDLHAAGALLDASQRSLADLYEVSCLELDALCSLARSLPGCHGARLTGAGFGGCVIALVERGRLAGFLRELSGTRTSVKTAIIAAFEARASDGAHLVSD
jgi:galactokinase